MKKLLLANLLWLTLLQADPWGKDADLTYKCPPAPSCKLIDTPLFGPLGECLIAFHQEVVSPADGPRSHYIPSSSQYTLDAMRKYGFFEGWHMGCDRLMRENDDPWIYPTIVTPDGTTLKSNPVP